MRDKRDTLEAANQLLRSSAVFAAGLYTPHRGARRRAADTLLRQP